MQDLVGWLAEVLAGSNKHNAAFEWYILHTLHRAHRKEKQMAAKKKVKVEMYASKALMAKHENSEGKKMAMMEKKMGEKNVVAKVKSSMKGKSAGKKTTKSI